MEGLEVEFLIFLKKFLKEKKKSNCYQFQLFQFKLKEKKR